MRVAVALCVSALFVTACGDDDASILDLLASSSSTTATSSSGGGGAGGQGGALVGTGGQAGSSGGSGPFMLTDSLKGSTLGNQVGGTLGTDGWTVTAATDIIWYALPRLVEGSIEFTVANVTMGNLVVNDNEVFALYEAGYGMVEPIPYNPEFRNNHYKAMIRIYGQAEVGREGQQKLMWGMCPSGAPGYDACGCASFFQEPFGGDGTWDGSAQTLRVEWGNGTTRYLRNGIEVLSIDWSASGLVFGPSELHFSLGTSRPSAVSTASMPIGAVFSDVVVQGTMGPLATCP